MYFEYPDKFLRITRLPPVRVQSQGTSNGRLLTLTGASGTEPPSVDRMIPDLNTDESVTTTRFGFNGETMLRSDHGVGYWESMLGGGPRQYARFAIPLLTRTTASYGTHPTSSSNLVQYAGDDGTMWSLALDPATHLPSAMNWIQVSRAGHPLADKRWTMSFSDFRRVGGVTWPYRMVTKLSGDTVEDIRITKYEINTKIPPNVFRK